MFEDTKERLQLILKGRFSGTGLLRQANMETLNEGGGGRENYTLPSSSQFNSSPSSFFTGSRDTILNIIRQRDNNKKNLQVHNDNDECLSMASSNVYPQIQVIEWHMMDKWKFYPLSMLSSFTIRCFLYPFTVIKTCMQLQQRNTVYTSVFNAFQKIYQEHGLPGFYRGFLISAFQIVSGVFYVSTYEGIRNLLLQNDIHDRLIRSLVAGGCASVVGQTFIVPFDVISQHLMVIGQKTSSNSVINPLNINYIGRTKSEIARQITTEIYNRDGLKGFYRGYCASLGTYVPNSALWWSFYQIYQEQLAKCLPSNSSHLLVQCISATFGGFTTTIITNPLDVCRARLQVQRLGSFQKTFTLLWQEEKLKIFTKGLSARLTQSAVFSFSIILGYETIKRLSVKEEYKENVVW